MEKATEYRTALNALRGFAATYVVLYHLRHFTDFDWFKTFPALGFGYIGVDFFFILSGLIISHVYLHKSQGAPLFFWIEFIWLRIARLLPVHLLIMLVLLLAALIGPVFDATWAPLTTQQMTDWFSLAFLFRQWLLPDAYVWNSPAWSVSAELFAYILVFPLIAIGVTRVDRRRLACLLMAIAAALFVFVVSKAGTINVFSGAGPLIRVTAGFLGGAGLYLLLELSNARVKWDALLGVVLVAAVPVFLAAQFIERAKMPADMLLIGYLATLICVTYKAEGRFADLLSRKPLFWLGEISFSLYLCHIPVLRMLACFADMAGIERSMAFGLSGLGCSIMVAHLLYHYVELPSRGKMRRWYLNLRASEGKAGLLNSPSS